MIPHLKLLMIRSRSGRSGFAARVLSGVVTAALACGVTIVSVREVRASSEQAEPAVVASTGIRDGSLTHARDVVREGSRLAIARLQYEGGGDWYANPSSLPNLLAAIAVRTQLPVERIEGRVRLTDPALLQYPFVHATGHGDITLSDAEIEALRQYLVQGGFLHVDDNYGLDDSFRREIARAFPDRPLVEVPLAHPIYNVVYAMPDGLPKIHEHDGAPAKGYGLFFGNRLALYYTVSSDLGNGWEDVGTHPGDPPELHERALRMGVNLFMYAITSRVTP